MLVQAASSQKWEKIRRPWGRGEGEGGGDGGNMVFKNKNMHRLLKIRIKSTHKPYYDQWNSLRT
jgi:hypothetical protein